VGVSKTALIRSACRPYASDIRSLNEREYLVDQIWHLNPVVGSHLGLRISNFAPKKPSNVRISTINILTFDGLASPLERQAELSRIGVRTLFAPVGSSHPEQR
jgi:hypothetical protein